MIGWRIAGVFAAAALLTSLSDWYFFGVLFHGRYFRTPGVWRAYRNKADEYATLGTAQVVMALSSLVFILVCARQGWVSARAALEAAVTAWVMIPLPLIAVNSLYIPMDRLLAVSHCLGWLARLVITALLVAWLL